jgi:hypothetical protein
MHGLQHRYEAPAVSDYGDLWGMTRTFHPLLGQAGGQELSFSSAHQPGSVQGEGYSHNVSSGDASGGGGSGGGPGGGSGGGSGGGGGGGGGKLPFTGLAAALVAGIGAGLVGAGGALRRVTRRKPRS